MIEGSSIWSSDWKAERASTYGVSEEELPTFYRGRTRLGVNVFAEDVAEAIAWIATRPSHVNIDELVIKPRAQAAQHKVHRET